ncbi:MAG: hypothetical protein ACM30G_01655, partial [Micromonosporaceae bacterium]
MCRKVMVSGNVDVLEICDIGVRRYREAVQQGSIASSEALPCLLQLGLLAPGPDGRLIPVPPTTAAQLAIEPVRQEVSRHERQLAVLDRSFASATTAYNEAQQDTVGELTMIQGARVISHRLQLAVGACTKELLTVQPGGRRPPELLERALASELPALRRGVRQRTIYQHAIRSHAPTMDYAREIT